MSQHEPAQLVGIEGLIYLIRSQRVMLDKDLAALYGVDTRSLVQAVKRNAQALPGGRQFYIVRTEV